VLLRCGCVQPSLLESDNDAAEKKRPRGKRRRRRKYEDDSETSDDDDDDDESDESADEDDDTDKHVRRRAGRTSKNLVRSFTGPELRRLIKSIKKFVRPTERLVICCDFCIPHTD